MSLLSYDKRPGSGIEKPKLVVNREGSVSKDSIPHTSTDRRKKSTKGTGKIKHLPLRFSKFSTDSSKLSRQVQKQFLGSYFKAQNSKL